MPTQNGETYKWLLIENAYLKGIFVFISCLHLLPISITVSVEFHRKHITSINLAYIRFIVYISMVLSIIYNIQLKICFFNTFLFQTALTQIAT